MKDHRRGTPRFADPTRPPAGTQRTPFPGHRGLVSGVAELAGLLRFRAAIRAVTDVARTRLSSQLGTRSTGNDRLATFIVPGRTTVNTSQAIRTAPTGTARHGAAATIAIAIVAGTAVAGLFLAAITFGALAIAFPLAAPVAQQLHCPGRAHRRRDRPAVRRDVVGVRWSRDRKPRGGCGNRDQDRGLLHAQGRCVTMA